MAISVYRINKGINKPIEFKGLKAQYIWYMGAVLMVLLIVYIILYVIGINQYVCVGIVFTTGIILSKKIFGMSKKYGQHGLTKMLARKSIPRFLKCRDREVFKFKNPERHGK
jgi:hypothetical protein